MKSVCGVPILKKSNWNCDFFHDFSKEKKFDVCKCPIARIYMAQNNHMSIISCSSDYKECVIYQNQDKGDILYIQKYIKKYDAGGYIYLSYKHIKIILKQKISVNSKEYLLLLFNYFGYFKTDIHNNKLADVIVLFKGKKNNI